MRVRFEFRPALTSTERFYELYFAFAHEGRVNAKAMPGLLDIAPVWPITSEHAVLATPPPVIQHALFRVLGPVARITGRQPPICRRAGVETERSPMTPNQRPPTRLTGAGATIDRRPRRSSVWSAAPKTRQGNRAEEQRRLRQPSRRGPDL